MTRPTTRTPIATALAKPTPLLTAPLSAGAGATPDGVAIDGEDPDFVNYLFILLIKVISRNHGKTIVRERKMYQITIFPFLTQVA
ncbi:hypothetical protein EUGRSUZ_G00891 [Eucalyptus grandis]|uniref:Uncharacterized protein n=2 Tax=Eucalyptus grandis TaxID=71139 RepID=A0ACC3K2D7_EUCGR|nr:hypothetical protein EUGRSUZ_G00891 [Eucalyptus grandis]